MVKRVRFKDVKTSPLIVKGEVVKDLFRVSFFQGIQIKKNDIPAIATDVDQTFSVVKWGKSNSVFRCFREVNYSFSLYNIKSCSIAYRTLNVFCPLLD